MSGVFLSSGKHQVKHEIGPRVIWETDQYTYMWVTYLCLSFLAHMNGETSLLNFLLDLPSSLFHQHTTLKTTQICTITQRAQLAKRKLQITGTLPNTMASLFPSLTLALIIPTVYDAWFLTSWQKWKPCCTYCFSNQQAGTCNSQIGFWFKTPPLCYHWKQWILVFPSCIQIPAALRLITQHYTIVVVDHFLSDL